MNEVELVEELCDGEPYSPQDVLFRDCEKVIKAGIWLIRNGYGQMAILPYAAPSGCYWRCEFHPVGQPQQAFYRYTSGNAGGFLRNHCGGSVRRTISPQGLAKAIMISVPDYLKKRCAGDVSPEMQEWLCLLERALGQKRLPQAFEDYGNYLQWKLVSLHGHKDSWLNPPPGYVSPGAEENWRRRPFWQACEDQGSKLREMGSICVDSTRLNQVVNRELATEVLNTIRDAGEYEAEQILLLAIQSVLFRLSQHSGA